jgi:hypothetical protein
MATMDVLNLHGGSPANFVSKLIDIIARPFPHSIITPFASSSTSLPLQPVISSHTTDTLQLDVGGGATADAVKKAFELLLSEKKVKSIFVNICMSLYIPQGQADARSSRRYHALRCHCRGNHQGDQGAPAHHPPDRQIAGNQGGRGKGVSRGASGGWRRLQLMIRRMIKESGLKIFPFGECSVCGTAVVADSTRWIGRGCCQGGRDGQVEVQCSIFMHPDSYMRYASVISRTLTVLHNPHNPIFQDAPGAITHHPRSPIISPALPSSP